MGKSLDIENKSNDQSGCVKWIIGVILAAISILIAFATLAYNVGHDSGRNEKGLELHGLCADKENTIQTLQDSLIHSAKARDVALDTAQYYRLALGKEIMQSAEKGQDAASYSPKERAAVLLKDERLDFMPVPFNDGYIVLGRLNTFTNDWTGPEDMKPVEGSIKSLKVGRTLRVNECLMQKSSPSKNGRSSEMNDLNILENGTSVTIQSQPMIYSTGGIATYWVKVSRN